MFVSLAIIVHLFIGSVQIVLIGESEHGIVGLVACITIVLCAEWVGHLRKSALGCSLVKVVINWDRLTELIADLVWVRIWLMVMLIHLLLIVLMFLIGLTQQSMLLGFEGHYLGWIVGVLELVNAVNQIRKVLVLIRIIRICSLIIV